MQLQIAGQERDWPRRLKIESIGPRNIEPLFPLNVDRQRDIDFGNFPRVSPRTKRRNRRGKSFFLAQKHGPMEDRRGGSKVSRDSF